MDDYVIDGNLIFSDQSSALKFYREQYHKKKEWQGLTNEEIMDACSAVWASHPIEVGRVVEEKLKEKNT